MVVRRIYLTGSLGSFQWLREKFFEGRGVSNFLYEKFDGVF
jgi:hypothetical protein